MNNKEIVDLIIGAYDVELARYANRVNEIEMTTIASTIQGLSINIDFHTFFTAGNISKLVDTVFETVLIRDFVLNLTYRANIVCGTMQADMNEYIESLVNSISSLSFEPDSDTASLIPKTIQEGLYVNETPLLNILKYNRWLLVLFTVLVNYDKTLIHKLSN